MSRLGRHLPGPSGSCSPPRRPMFCVRRAVCEETWRKVEFHFLRQALCCFDTRVRAGFKATVGVYGTSGKSVSSVTQQGIDAVYFMRFSSQRCLTNRQRCFQTV